MNCALSIRRAAARSASSRGAVWKTLISTYMNAIALNGTPSDGEAMTDVCRVFGISSKTCYKIFDRYKGHGLAALSDRSPAAHLALAETQGRDI